MLTIHEENLDPLGFLQPEVAAQLLKEELAKINVVPYPYDLENKPKYYFDDIEVDSQIRNIISLFKNREEVQSLLRYDPAFKADGAQEVEWYFVFTKTKLLHIIYERNSLKFKPDDKKIGVKDLLKLTEKEIFLVSTELYLRYVDYIEEYLAFPYGLSEAPL